MYLKWPKWGTFVPQRGEFVLQSGEYLLYKCTSNWEGEKRIPLWVRSGGKLCFGGSFRQLWNWDKKRVSILKNSRRFWKILEKYILAISQMRWFEVIYYIKLRGLKLSTEWGDCVRGQIYYNEKVVFAKNKDWLELMNILYGLWFQSILL